MFAHQKKRVQLLFAVTDALFTIAAFEAAYQTRAHLHLDFEFYFTLSRHLLLLSFCVAIWVALGSQQRVYEYIAAVRPRQVVADTLRQCIGGVICLVIFEYLLRLDVSRFFIYLFFAYNLLLLTVFRWNARFLVGLFQRGLGGAYHLVLVGEGARVAVLHSEIERNSPFRTDITAHLQEDECTRLLPRLLAQNIVDEVIFCVESDRLSALEDVFLFCDEEGVRTRVFLDFFPHVNSEMSLDRVGNAPLLTFSAAPADDVSLLAKRAIDVVVSLLAVVILSPLMLLAAVLVKLTSRGPIIYRQKRCGLNGRRFTLYKFRSMVENADALKERLAHLSEKQIAFKIPRDPRVTAVGRWLRKFSIDEWPQFYNILRGDMSLVGPRPPLPGEVDRYERWQRRRLRMRPGLTCLWVLMGRDKLNFDSWMKMDMDYIDNWSLRLDWSILVRTIPHVLTGRGAH
ncbi:MAG TPA: sugar transferase [Bryobacteraceae bacterium]|nr:sugar transferase [Bryobacteraceae bacterium]